MIRHICSCGKTYHVKDDMVGRKVKCPACQAVLTVIPQAELVPMAPTQPAGPVGLPGRPPAMAPLQHDPLASLPPLGAAHPFGDPMSRGPAMSPLIPQSASLMPLGGLSPAQPTGVRGRVGGSGGYPAWVWIATGGSGMAAAGAMVLVVAVVARMNRPNSGNLARNAPTTIPLDRGPDSGSTNKINSPAVVRDSKGHATIGEELGQWQTYSSTAGGYSINLPGKPQVLPQSINTVFGRVEGSTAVIGGDTTGMMVIISHMNVPYDTAQFPADKLLEASFNQQQVTIVKSGDVQIAGRTGKEFAVTLSSPGGPGKGLFRALGIGGRVYTMAYMGPSNQFDEAAARKCLDSFAITKEPPPASANMAASRVIPVQTEVAWVKHESEKGQFRIDMPAAPTNVGTAADGATETYFESLACMVAQKGEFAVAASAPPSAVLPEAVPTMLEVQKGAVVRQFKKIISESTAKQGEYVVADLVLEGDEGNRALVRIYASTVRIYHLTWVGPVQEASSAEVNRFFTSFSILPAARQPAPATTSQPATTPAATR